MSPLKPRPVVNRSFTSASDGYAFYYRHFAPPGTPRARLVFVHGIRSHGGWYERRAARFAEPGSTSTSSTAAAAGLTPPTAATPRVPPTARRLAEFVQRLAPSGRGCRSFLCGISWGGKLAVGLPYRKPGLVDGLVLLCPGLVPKVAPPFAAAIADRARPPFCGRASSSRSRLNEPELFTRVRRVAAVHRRRPARPAARDRPVPVQQFLAGHLPERAAKRVRVPTLLMLAEHDRIIDNEQTHYFAGRFDTPVSVIDYPGAHPHARVRAGGPPLGCRRLGLDRQARFSDSPGKRHEHDQQHHHREAADENPPGEGVPRLLRRLPRKLLLLMAVPLPGLLVVLASCCGSWSLLAGVGRRIARRSSAGARHGEAGPSSSGGEGGPAS